MNRRMTGIGIWIALSVMTLFGAGCAAVAVGVVGGGVATAVYKNGELSQAYSVPIEKAWKASEEVVAEKNMKVSEKFIDNTERNRAIKGKTQDGKDFQINLEAKTAEVTTIRVRIGFAGDEAYSRNIQEWISQKF